MRVNNGTMKLIDIIKEIQKNINKYGSTNITLNGYRFYLERLRLKIKKSPVEKDVFIHTEILRASLLEKVENNLHYTNYVRKDLAENTVFLLDPLYQNFLFDMKDRKNWNNSPQNPTYFFKECFWKLVFDKTVRVGETNDKMCYLVSDCCGYRMKSVLFIKKFDRVIVCPHFVVSFIFNALSFYCNEKKDFKQLVSTFNKVFDLNASNIFLFYYVLYRISKCKYLYRFLSSGVEPLIQSVNRLDWQSLNINNKYKKSLQEDIDSVVELIQEDYKSEILDVVFASIEALIPSNTHYKQSSTSKLDIEVDNLCKGVFVLE